MTLILFCTLLGGTPRRIILDNAKVGVKEGFGKYAKTQDRYAELAANYAFRTDFCNPSEGHEKGLVENLVEYARNNFLVPVPKVESLADLNRYLLQECQTYNNTHKIWDREFPVSRPPKRHFSHCRPSGTIPAAPIRQRSVTFPWFGSTPNYTQFRTIW